MSKVFLQLNFRLVFFFLSLGLLSLVLWNFYDFSKKFKKNERLKMELLAQAYNELGTADFNEDFSFEVKIIESNDNIPMIVTDENGQVLMKRNLDPSKASEEAYIEHQLSLMKSQNAPIVIKYLADKSYLIHYRDSDMMMRLKYYPIAILMLLFLFTGLIYLVFRTSKISGQNQLWSGMAKETAHQIGTPLSSLMGWVEMMKVQKQNPEIVLELEKDIDRLRIITDRFSKIGSVPRLAPTELGERIENSVAYFQARSSKSIRFISEKSEKPVWVLANKPLLDWVLENLIKNAIDAMSGKGTLTIQMVPKESKWMEIFVSDSGKGIPRKVQKKIFDPGFTTRKRGWGLGLSLSKRIVENYHHGKLYLKKTTLGGGSTFAIRLKLQPEVSPQLAG